MRQAIRALGWATAIFWVILLLFTLTMVYSAFQIRPGFGDPYSNASGGVLTASLPFYIENGGLYDITNLNVTTLIKDQQSNRISDSSTVIPTIPHGRNASATHDMKISLSQLTTESLSHLLFNDSDLNIDISFALNYANAVPLKISTNFKMPWGAPLSDLAIGNISLTPYNMTHTGVLVSVSFENHSYFDLNGVIRLELIDNANRVMGWETANITVPPEGSCDSTVEIPISRNPAAIREVHLYFQTSAFNYGPVVVAIG